MVTRKKMANFPFETLDRLDIYCRNPNAPLSEELDMRNHIWLRTTWDTYDGVPYESVILSDPDGCILIYYISFDY
jgi:hypothetical protein